VGWVSVILELWITIIVFASHQFQGIAGRSNIERPPAMHRTLG
jgi:hypothetical protein